MRTVTITSYRPSEVEDEDGCGCDGAGSATDKVAVGSSCR